MNKEIRDLNVMLLSNRGVLMSALVYFLRKTLAKTSLSVILSFNSKVYTETQYDVDLLCFPANRGRHRSSAGLYFCIKTFRR